MGRSAAAILRQQSWGHRDNPTIRRCPRFAGIPGGDGKRCITRLNAGWHFTLPTTTTRSRRTSASPLPGVGRAPGFRQLLLFPRELILPTPHLSLSLRPRGLRLPRTSPPQLPCYHEFSVTVTAFTSSRRRGQFRRRHRCHRTRRDLEPTTEPLQPTKRPFKS